MRVLVVEPGPNFSVADVCNGWVRGLRALGCDVVQLNLADRLTFYETAHTPDGEGGFVQAFNADQAISLAAKGVESACLEFWPDVVVFVSGFFVPPDVYDLLRARGIKVVLLHTESPYEDDRQLRRAPHADLNVLNDPTNLDAYPKGSIYLPHCYDPWIHTPDGEVDELSDVCMVGTGYPSRVRFLEQIDWNGLTLRLGGNWDMLRDDSPLKPYVMHRLDWCLPNTEAVKCYRGAKTSLNLYRREASHNCEGWAMGPREVELAAVGCFYLTESRGENREVLPMIPTFDGPADYVEQLGWWLEHDEDREKIALAARAAIEGRTFTENARVMLEAVS